MANVTEVQFMKPTAFTVGTDVHLGITRISYTKNAPETYPVIPEGNLQPTRYEQIESDRPPVEGTIESNSAGVLSLAGVAVDGDVTIDGIDAVSGSARKITIEDPTFLEVRGGGERRRPGVHVVAFRATDLSEGAGGS